MKLFRDVIPYARPATTGKFRPGQTETAAEDARGSSAILAAVRSARVLNFMTQANAEKLGMSDEDRKLHVRLSNGKANMDPPVRHDLGGQAYDFSIAGGDRSGPLR